MTWILFSILAAFLWATTNIIDKFVFTKWIKKPTLPLVILGIIGLAASVSIYFIRGLAELSTFNASLAIANGILYIIAVLLYFEAVKVEEISRVVSLLYLSPLFVLILALIFLGEIFTPIKYLGIFSLIIGALIISIKSSTEVKFNKAFWLILLSSFIFATNSVITKYLLGFADFWTIFSYTRIGVFISLLPVYYFGFKEISLLIAKHGKRAIGLMTINEILGLVASLFYIAAYSIGYITLVSAVSSTQPFFALLLATLLSIFYPTILKEEISKSTIALKAVAIVLMFIGVILIT